MNVDGKILNEILADQLQHCLKEITHHDQMRFIPGVQMWYNIHKSINVIHHINIMKDKNYQVISIDVEKAFDKIQHPFMTNTLSKLRIEGTYRNIIRAICDKPTACIILNGQKLQVFPLRSGTRSVLSTFITLIQHCTGNPSHSRQAKRRNKKNLNWKEKLKLCLFADDVILYIENPKDATKKLLELINEFSKVAGYKINIQKSVALLYASNELTEKGN